MVSWGTHASNLLTKRQGADAAEKQAFFHITTQGGCQLIVDAELSPARQTVTQATLGQAVEVFGAMRLVVHHGLQLAFNFQVGAQPRRGHGARRQAGNAGEFQHVVFFGLCQDALELGVGIAFFGHGKGRAELDGRRAERLQARNVFETANATGGDQGNLFLNASGLQEFDRLRNDILEVKARVVQVGDPGRTQMTACQSRVLDHDGVRQALFALPFLDDQLNAARIGQDGNQCGLRMVLCQVGQVQRQAGAHHHGIDAALQCTTYRRGIFTDGAHHIDGQQAAALGQFACRADFPPQGF